MNKIYLCLIHLFTFICTIDSYGQNPTVIDDNVEVNGYLRTIKPGSSSNGSKLMMSSPQGYPGFIIMEGDGTGNVGSRWDTFVRNKSFVIGDNINYSQKDRLIINSLGYVGIGITNPTTNLDISMPSVESALRIRSGNANASFTKSQIAFSYNNNATYSHAIKTRHNGGSLDRNSIDFYIWQPGDDVNGIGTKHVMSLNGGKVGIGTVNPSSNLEVKSSMSSPSTYEIQKWTNTHHSGYDLSLKTIWDVDGINHSFIQKFNGIEYNSLSFFAGRIGIGTKKPKNKLSVEGTIWAKKIKVTMEDAADWVFEEDYELRSLKDVEAHITKYKHLPDMPSAEEFKENDMDVAEMNNKLLQKIEELTLYLIEQNKEIEILKAKLEVKD